MRFAHPVNRPGRATGSDSAKNAGAFYVLTVAGATYLTFALGGKESLWLSAVRRTAHLVGRVLKNGKGFLMNKRKRFKDKVDFVVLWLLEFGCSTPSLICRAMDLNRANQGHFFLSLKKSGLVKTVKNPLIVEEIYLLSVEGKAHGAFLSEKAEKYWLSPSKVVMSTTVHSFSIQRAIAERWGVSLPFKFQSEKFIQHIHLSKRPDALIDDNGLVVALEVELTQKSSNRIFLGFLNHLEALKANLYQKILYVFPTEALMKSYVKRFNQEQWPKVIKDKNGHIRQEINDGDFVDLQVGEGARKRFEFVVQKGY